MKGIYGLGVAVALGIAAALFNFFYLSMRSQDVERVYFVGIARDVGPGERLSEAVLEPEGVGIPERWIGNLDKFAIRDKDRSTVLDQPVWRMLQAGSLLLRDDLKTPPQEVELAEDERIWPIPVDAKTLVPSLMAPGAQVWFMAPTVVLDYPTRASIESFVDGPSDNPGEESDGVDPPESSESPTPPVKPYTSTDIIGPFTVVALGNRLGSAQVMRAARVRQVQENVLQIRIKVQADGSLEPRAQALRELLDRTQSRPLRLFWHPGVTVDK